MDLTDSIGFTPAYNLTSYSGKCYVDDSIPLEDREEIACGMNKPKNIYDDLLVFDIKTHRIFTRGILARFCIKDDNNFAFRDIAKIIDR